MSERFDRRRAVFACFGVRNYRRFWLANAGSQIGTWMQVTALSWLVFRLTGSSAELGLVIGLQRAPTLPLGLYAGVTVDRFDTRRLLIALQSLMCLQAMALALLTVTGLVRPWHVFVLAAMLGVCEAFERPAREVLARELVEDRMLRNALSLNAAASEAAFAVGSGAAGVLIAAAGEGWCFVINGASFLSLLIVLVRLDRRSLRPSPAVDREPGQLRAGLRHAARTPTIAASLAMTMLAFLLAFQPQVWVPTMAAELQADSRAYGSMFAAISVGAVVGALCIAPRCEGRVLDQSRAAGAAAVLLLGAACAPTLAVELLMLALLGAATVTFFVIGTTTVQLAAPEDMRGRMATLRSMAYALGAAGAPFVGWIGSAAGARIAVSTCAASFLLVAAIGLIAIRRG